MTKLALSVAAMLLASSAAFAGSDHFEGGNQPSVDTAVTASISDTAPRNGADAQLRTEQDQTSVQDIVAQHDRDSLWGR
ncbi:MULTISPECIES: DUF680 domain-containing protein [Mesorhizobium]|uniref:Uncharacterized protein n=1 Tax=Rhizobium loti TaxID=381 RepID=A0A6M7U2J7_RHILI|nr:MULTISPECIES: DUF680 domain-containing protein [Mesorhizobium]KRB23461.1 hypothetical protein ASE05_12695 [Mesorhizobium sp. Root172]OBQ66804.1 hypothetical protein A8145_30870 [Mesorhizobium loti]QKC70578.1 DUF680 domain-containing protein [Mesorhizobium loti]